jgi:hypothetical protein
MSERVWQFESELHGALIFNNLSILKLDVEITCSTLSMWKNLKSRYPYFGLHKMTKSYISSREHWKHSMLQILSDFVIIVKSRNKLFLLIFFYVGRVHHYLHLEFFMMSQILKKIRHHIPWALKRILSTLMSQIYIVSLFFRVDTNSSSSTFGDEIYKIWSV